MSMPLYMTRRPESQHHEHQPHLLLPLYIPDSQHHEHQPHLVLPLYMTTRPDSQHYERQEYEHQPHLLSPLYMTTLTASIMSISRTSCCRYTGYT